MYKSLFLVVISAILFGSPCLGVTIPASMKQAMKTIPDTPGMANIIASLIIVILMIYVVGWFYMRLTQINSKNIFKQPKNFELNKPKIISGITLGQNRNLYVVALNRKYLVLGVTPNNISLIKEFDPEQESEVNDFIKNALDGKNGVSEEEQIVDKLFKETKIQKKVLNKDIEDICNKYL